MDDDKGRRGSHLRLLFPGVEDAALQFPLSVI